MVNNWNIQTFHPCLTLSFQTLLINNLLHVKNEIFLILGDLYYNMLIKGKSEKMVEICDVCDITKTV